MPGRRRRDPGPPRNLKKATRPGVEEGIFRRASKDEAHMKVSAFARWLDLQNRMSLKEVQAVLGSLKYSRTAPVDVVIFDHVLDYLQAKNKKWADERLVMIDMKPPPQPKKKVEAPAPAPPVEVRTYYEPPAQPRSPLFGRTSEPKEEKPAPVEEEEAPSRPETSYEFTDARPQSAPADGRRRRRKKKKKRRKSKKRAGFFSLKADDEDAKLPHLRPLAKAQQLSLVEDTLFAPEPGVRAVEEGGGAKEGGEFVVPSGLMSRAMYLTLKAGGAPAVPQASPAKSELTPDESPQKNKQTRGTQHPRRIAAELGVEWEERPSSAPALRSRGAECYAGRIRRPSVVSGSGRPSSVLRIGFSVDGSKTSALSGSMCDSSTSPSAGGGGCSSNASISRWSRPVKMPMAKYKPPKATLFSTTTRLTRSPAASIRASNNKVNAHDAASAQTSAWNAWR